MTDLPPGEPFNAICTIAQYHSNPFRYCTCGWIEPEPEPVKPKLHAYVQMKDLNDGVKFATRLALDRARRENYNPRKGTLTVYFDDDGVGAKWEPLP
jgi:hypothetical protein